MTVSILMWPAWPNLDCCKRLMLSSPHRLSDLISYSSVTLQLQPQWSPCCFVKAPDMLSLRVCALAVPSAWNSPPLDVCEADILTHSRSWFKGHLLSVRLPVHALKGSLNSLTSSVLLVPMPPFYFSPWHLYHLLQILIAYHLPPQQNKSSRRSEAYDCSVH